MKINVIAMMTLWEIFVMIVMNLDQKTMMKMAMELMMIKMLALRSQRIKIE